MPLFTYSLGVSWVNHITNMVVKICGIELIFRYTNVSKGAFFHYAVFWFHSESVFPLEISFKLKEAVYNAMFTTESWLGQLPQERTITILLNIKFMKNSCKIQYKYCLCYQILEWDFIQTFWSIFFRKIWNIQVSRCNTETYQCFPQKWEVR